MPMGLTNAPATFMQTMNNLFSDMLDSGVILFLDDIIVYLQSVDENYILLEKVLVWLSQYTIYCKLNKCSFLHNTTMFLVFDVTPKGMRISNLKVQILNEWFVPSIVK